jgi:hypothetical protein
MVLGLDYDSHDVGIYLNSCLCAYKLFTKSMNACIMTRGASYKLVNNFEGNSLMMQDAFRTCFACSRLNHTQLKTIFFSSISN